VAGGHGPTGLQVEACPWGELASLGPAEQRSWGTVELNTGRPEGCRPVDIVWACGLQAWWGWGVDQRIIDPMASEQQLCGPMGQDLACSASCSAIKSWCGEPFHELQVHSAKVSALPGALPQPSVSPVSQQSPWFTELTLSLAVSQSPSWISINRILTVLCYHLFSFSITLWRFIGVVVCIHSSHHFIAE
jgi:hypothetical protein